MTYELRKLCSKDIFPMSKIISKIGIGQFRKCFESDEVKSMIANAGKEEDISSAVGFAVVLDIGEIILSNLPVCEKEIYAFLEDLSGSTADELKEISIADFAEMIITLVKKPEFSDFFKVVSKLFNSEK